MLACAVSLLSGRAALEASFAFLIIIRAEQSKRWFRLAEQIGSVFSLECRVGLISWTVQPPDCCRAFHQFLFGKNKRIKGGAALAWAEFSSCKNSWAF